jgi:hypothetical protein
LAGWRVSFEFEIDEDGDVVFVGVGPFFEVVQAVDERVADGVWVEVCYVEDLDAWFQKDGAVERRSCVGQIGEGPCGGWIVQAAFLIRVQVEFQRSDGLVLQLKFQLGVRVVVVLRRGNVFLEYGSLGPRYLAMVRVVSSDDLGM